ncbi:hypothetical protein CXP51_08385 [Ethanoligenens harbinense]|nr:hypothetical protein CXP51_08385 [Ethanoligenens harbinense]
MFAKNVLSYNKRWGGFMNVLVHLLFARRIHAAVREQIGVRLSWSGFLLGNILPDLSAKYNVHPHFSDVSMDFVLGRATALYDREEEKSLDSFAFAKDIGVVTHYLSDFCCYVHTKRFCGDMKQHHWYEWQMLFAFGKGAARFGEEMPEMADTPDTFRLFLKRSLREQQKTPPGGCADVFYALRVSTAMTMLLLRKAICTEAARLYHAKNLYVFHRLEENWNESRLLL